MSIYNIFYWYLIISIGFVRNILLYLYWNMWNKKYDFIGYDISEI